MYGHVESPQHVVNHLDLRPTIQKNTHGFTELVPLRFIQENTMLFRKGLVRRGSRSARFPDVRASRLFLRGQIDNIQTSWVKWGSISRRLR